MAGARVGVFLDILQPLLQQAEAAQAVILVMVERQAALGIVEEQVQEEQEVEAQQEALVTMVEAVAVSD